MIRNAWFLLVLLLLLAGCSAVPDTGPLPESPLLRILERKSGLIAYIGADGNVYTIDQGGGNQKQVTDDARVTEAQGAVHFYQFPTWSWDGQRIAFVAIDRSQEDSLTTSLSVSGPDGEDRVELFQSSGELPYYLYWSPDDEKISFLTSSVNSDKRLLRLVPVNGGEAQVVDVGNPYFWSWSPDSQKMIVNVGGPAENNPNAHIAFLHFSEGVQERRLDLSPYRFQAPHWSPKEDQLLLAAQASSGEGVMYLTSLQGSPIRELVTFEGQIAFGWSPEGEHVAYISTESSDPEANGNLKVVSLLEEADAISPPEDGVVAFYWSPDSAKIAYLIPIAVEGSQAEGQQEEGQQEEGQQDQSFLLRLNILEIDSGKTRTIANFQPTQQFLTILPTFDQYQRSATFWSPDSENLVLSAITEEGGPGIWVVPASGRLPPRFITPGIIAFWSWK